MPTLEKFTETLPCKLTEEELLAKGKTLSELCEEIAKVEDEKAASSKHFNGIIGDLKTRRAELARQVRSGLESRPVDCADEVIRDDKTVVTLRLDTNEKIRSRPAREDELYKAPSLFDAEGSDRPIGRDTEPEPPNTTPEPPPTVGPTHEQ